MTAPDFDDIAEALLRLRPLPLEARERELERLYEINPAVHDEVRSLLESASGSDRLFEEPIAFAGGSRSIADEMVSGGDHPTTIAGYRVLGRLGAGGMGVVYRAQQEQPHREVAIKVLHPTFVSDSVAKRLLREAEVLGRLQHPGIAQIYGAGVDAGQDGAPGLGPYLIMELVPGRVLLDHVHETRRDVDSRLELFAEICDAVAHAHERAVVHRDIKPDNIIVTEEGHPKVLDFGIARVTDPERAVTTMHTRAGQIIGTISYMSPEQIAGDSNRIDARTDVYALGVLLFEMLSDRLPFDLGALPIAEAARIIRDDEPTQLGSVHTGYRGDLETIVARAIEKDPARRYQSAAAMGRDVRRHLANEPIHARPASRAYRIRKFARRNRALVMGVVSTIVVLAAGLVASLAFAAYGLRQESLARAATADSEKARYRLSVNLASAQIEDDQQDRARETLLAAPEHLRGWEWHHLWLRLSPMHPVRRDGPQNRVASAGLRADGAWLFAAFDGDAYTVIDAETQEQVAVLEDAVNTGSLRFNAGATHLIGRADGRVVIWDAATGERSWVGSPSPWSPDMLSRDGRTFTAYIHSTEPTGWAWSLRSTDGRVLIEEGHGMARARFSSFSHDGSRLVVQTWNNEDSDQMLTVLDGKTGEVLAEREITGDRHAFARPAWSPTGDRIITSETAPDYAVYDARTLETIRTIPRRPASSHLIGLTGGCSFVDEDRVIVVEHDRSVMVVDLETGEKRQLRARDPGRRLLQTSAVGRGDSIAVGDQQWMTLLYVDSSPAVGTLIDSGDSINAVDWHPDSRRLATASWDERIRLWDTASGSVLDSISADPTADHTDRPASIRFVENGSVIEALTTWDFWEKHPSAIYRWNIGTGDVATTEIPSWKKAVDLLSPGTCIDGQYPGDGTNFTGDYRAISTDGRLAAVPSEVGVRVYVRGSGETVHDLPIGRRIVAFGHADGELYTGAASGIVESFDLGSGERIARQTRYTSKIYGFAVQPGGGRVAVLGADGGVLLESETLEVLMRLDGHSGYIRAARFSPDGRTLATASGDGTVRLWLTRPARSSGSASAGSTRPSGSKRSPIASPAMATSPASAAKRPAN